MSHFDWAHAKVTTLNSAQDRNLYEAAEQLVGAWLALRGRSGTIFGLVAASFEATPQEHEELVSSISQALGEIARRAAETGDPTLLNKLSKLGSAHDVPELQPQATAAVRVSHPLAPWIEIVPSGVFHFVGASEEWIHSMLSWFAGIEIDGDYGGFDLVQTNSPHNRWLLVGTWSGCLAEANRRTIAQVAAGIRNACTIVAAGLSVSGTGAVSLDTSHPEPNQPQVEMTEIFAHAGVFEWDLGPDDAKLKHHTEHSFPSLPDWIGVQEGSAQWLGDGVSRDGERISSVSEYIRLRRLDATHFELSALASRERFDRWFDAFLRCAGPLSSPRDVE